MKTGTKSVLFGVHQFIWHPITVARAWKALYGRWPGGWESIAIVVHDWGYWGCDNMDDAVGEQHPVAGATLIRELYLATHKLTEKNIARSWELFYLAVYHSRYLSARDGVPPSKLCWADKLSMSFDPAWFYLLRGHLSGEVKQYRKSSKDKINLVFTDAVWFEWCSNKCARDAIEKRLAVARNHDREQPE